MNRDESKFVAPTKKKEGFIIFGDNAKGGIIDQGNMGITILF